MPVNALGVLVLATTLAAGVADGPDSAPSWPRLRLVIEEQGGLDYTFTERVQADYTCAGQRAQALEFSNSSSLALRGVSGASANTPSGENVLKLTLMSPQLEEVMLELGRDGAATTLADDPELLPGVPTRYLQNEVRYTPALIAQRGVLLVSGGPDTLENEATWTQYAEVPRPCGDTIGVKTHLNVASIDRQAGVVRLECEIEETLVNPASEPWGPLRLRTIEYTASFRGSTDWDFVRSHCAATTLTGTVSQRRELPDRRALESQERVSLTVNRSRQIRPKRDAASQPTTQAGVRPTSAPAAPAERVAGARHGADGSPVVAMLGEFEITDAQVTAELQRGLKGRPWPQGEKLESLKRQVLSQRIVGLAFQTYAEEHPDIVPAAEIDAAVAKQEEEYANQGGDYDTILTAFGLTRAQARDAAKAELALRKVTEGSQDPTRARAFYEQNKAGFDGTHVLVQDIAIPVDPVLGDEAAHQEARATLERARAAVRAGEMTFEQALAKYDQKPRRDLPPLTRYGAIDEPIAAAVFDMKVGELSTPIRSNSGWHLIKVTAREPGAPLAFDAALPLIREHLRINDFESIVSTQLAKHRLTLYGGH